MASHVQGIGGVFIDSKDPKRLAEWYTENLGLKFEGNEGGYYIVFRTRDPESSVLRANPVFSINPAKEPLAEKGRGFVLNLRVDDLHTLLDDLRAKGVTVEEKTIEWEYGKHGWIRDGDGIRVELYEEILMGG